VCICKREDFWAGNANWAGIRAMDDPSFSAIDKRNFGGSHETFTNDITYASLMTKF